MEWISEYWYIIVAFWGIIGLVVMWWLGWLRMPYYREDWLMFPFQVAIFAWSGGIVLLIYLIVMWVDNDPRRDNRLFGRGEV